MNAHAVYGSNHSASELTLTLTEFKKRSMLLT